MTSTMSYPQKEKVLAYILRKLGDKKELLVFTQPAYPEAGIQVPAGTIELGEAKLDALLREVNEECGLDSFTEIQYLGTTNFVAHSKREIHRRFYYQLDFAGESPDKFEHRVGGKGIDAEMIFSFEWMDIETLPQLIAAQDELISKIKA